MGKRETRKDTARIGEIHAGTPISERFGKDLPGIPLQCIGGVCFTPAGEIQITIEPNKCPPETIEDIVRSTIQGKGVVFNIARAKPVIEETKPKKGEK